MFRKPDQNDEILKYLAHAYQCYQHADWNYARSDAGVGGFLVDGCITNSESLKKIATIIGKGLIDDKENAKTACQLFEKLYANGFKDGQFKKEIQQRFAEILPEKSVERLKEGGKMDGCLKSICVYEDSMNYRK